LSQTREKSAIAAIMIVAINTKGNETMMTRQIQSGIIVTGVTETGSGTEATAIKTRPEVIAIKTTKEIGIPIGGETMMMITALRKNLCAKSSKMAAGRADVRRMNICLVE
jgi:hypothetical protein